MIDIAISNDDDGDGVDNAILIARFITVDCTHRCRNHLNMCNPCAQLSEQSAKQKKANSIRLRKTHQNNKRSNKRNELLTARIKCTILKLSQSDEMLSAAVSFEDQQIQILQKQQYLGLDEKHDNNMRTIQNKNIAVLYFQIL